MRARVLLPAIGIFLLSTYPALASNGEIGETFPTSRVWHVQFDQPSVPGLTLPVTIPAEVQEPAAQARPQAFEYSDGYQTRRKIHMIASFATLPLVAGQYITGDKLYNGDASDSMKAAHGAFAGGIAALFAVNTVTGVWNLVEARHDPNGKARRLIHGILMLGADAGFTAAGMMAPDDDEVGGSDRSAHRNVAIASMGVAAASYLYMLVTR